MATEDALVSDEPEGQAGDAPERPWWRRSRTLVIAAIVAGVTGAITGGVGDLLSASWVALWRQIKPQPAIEVNVASDVASFQRVSVYPPEFVVPVPVDELPAPPPDSRGYGARETWAVENGGVPADLMEVQVRIAGRSEQPVILTNLRVNVVERRRPLSGTHVVYGPIGEVVAERFVAVDLDQQPPTITGSVDDRPMGDPSIEPDPINFPYRVRAGEVEVFHLFVTTTTCDCQWNAELSYAVGSEQATISIQSGNEPFRLTSSARADTYASNDGATFEKAPNTQVPARSDPEPSPTTQPSATQPSATTVCIKDPAGDVQPQRDRAVDVVRLCAEYTDVVRVSAATRGSSSPLKGEYDRLTVGLDVDDDQREDYFADLSRDGAVSVIDLAGTQSEACTGTGGWDGAELSIEVEAACVGDPDTVGIFADVFQSRPTVTVYDSIPDLPPRGQIRPLLRIAAPGS
jgi:hypothetical protein